MILQRKEYTKLMKCRDYKREWIYDYIRKGKIIMYDIADIRLFEYQKFYFGVSKRTDEKHITRDVSYHSSGHIVVQKFDRIVYISREVKNRYLKQKNRIQRVDKILNS